MTKIKFEGILLTVTNLERARKFYENVLEQVPIYDYDYDGQMIAYESGITLAPEWAYADWLSGAEFSVKRRANISQLYFEVEDLEAMFKKIKADSAIDWLHEPIMSSYGAYTMRFYDYDGHIIEIAESVAFVAKRFLAQGLSITEIAERFGDSEAVVEELIAQK
ncbi:VOC family protein [Lactococcus nasutitermitis]|uniref:VOC family protein n=1 Tax=Lactococcus nasutitermitis TaxID=1652957 RepID=A0ABV9JGY9_9LACT|nr:VOC family protein [Lactococcus nasutitermitis]